MAVDLSIPNSIIGAYAQGRAEALERVKNAQQQQQLVTENQQRQQQIDQQQKQFEATLKQHDAETKAHLDLLRAAHQLDIVKTLPELKKLAESTGNVPGFTQTGMTPQNMPPGYLDTGQRTFIGNPALGLGDVSFDALSPEASAAQLGRTTTIAKTPVLAQELSDFKDRANFASNLETQTKIKTAEGLLPAEKQMKDYEAAIAATAAEKDYEHRRGIVDLQGQWEAYIKGFESPELWTHQPIAPELIKNLGLPEGSTWNDLGLTGMEDVGKKKLQAYDSIESGLRRVQNAFAQRAAELAKEFPSQFPNTPEGTKAAIKAAYEQYFQGGFTGTIKDVWNKIVPDDFVESVRPELAKIFLQMKEVNNLGSALTENESRFLKGFTLSGERNETATRAMSILQNAIPDLHQAEYDTVSTYGKGKHLGAGGVVKVDAGGNIIGGSVANTPKPSASVPSKTAKTPTVFEGGPVTNGIITDDLIKFIQDQNKGSKPSRDVVIKALKQSGYKMAGE